MMVTMKILDLGCGKSKYPGSIGVDISDKTDADIIHDLNVYPYPFEEDVFDSIICDNVLEHLNDVIKTMDEIWRISKNGARIKINVPYFRSVYSSIDPTHKHFFTYNSFYYFDEKHLFNELYKYSDSKFEVEKVLFDESISSNTFHRFVKFFANKNPQFYEIHISHLIPLNELTFYLRTIK